MQEKLLSNQQKLNDINYNYRKIEENIANAAIKSGRTRDDIIFLAATKTVDVEYINYAVDITFLAATKTVDVEYINYAVSLGLRYIGENKVQELLSKYEGYALDKCSLQFIGHLQSNKVRQIVGKVDMIQSVDSVRLAESAVTVTSGDGKDGIHVSDDADEEQGTESDSFFYMADGNLTVTSGDDGIHADASVIIEGGTILINESYEGIEGLSISIIRRRRLGRQITWRHE